MKVPLTYYDWYPEVYVQGLGSCHQVTNDAPERTAKREPLGFQLPKPPSTGSVTAIRKTRRQASNRHKR